MNTLVILSGGGEALFVGFVIGLLSLLVSFIYKTLKPKVQQATTNILLNVNPNDVNSLIKKGYSEVSKKSYILAISYFQKALNLTPNNVDALAGIAFAYHLSKDYVNSKISIEAYQNSINSDSIDNSMTGIMTYLYGHHHYMEGNLEEAKTCKENSKVMASISNSLDIINSLNLY